MSRNARIHTALYTARIREVPVAEVISARVGEHLLAHVDGIRGEQTRAAWVTSLIERELTDGPAPASPSLPSLASAMVSQAPAPSA